MECWIHMFHRDTPVDTDAVRQLERWNLNARGDVAELLRAITARHCTVCSLVYCTHTNRYSSALDTWAVFHTSRMRRLRTNTSLIRMISRSAYGFSIFVITCLHTSDERVQTLYTSCSSNRFKSIFCSAYLKASA